MAKYSGDPLGRSPPQHQKVRQANKMFYHLKKNSRPHMKRRPDPRIGNMPITLNPKKPVTANEKKLLRRLQKFGKDRSKERYDNYKRRIGDANVKMGQQEGRKRRIGTRSIGGVGLGFSVHFDKKNFFEGMNGEVKLLARTAQTMTQRFAINQGLSHANTRLSITDHLGGKDKSRKAKGDIWDVLKNSLNTMETPMSVAGRGRFIRHVAGTYGAGEWPANAENPTGVIGQHTGKKVNLSEMYEDGTGPFAFSNKLVTLFASSGAVRSRGDNYVATLKGNHPGFPAVRYMAHWMFTTNLELNQATYDETALYLTNRLLSQMGAGGY